VAHLQANDLVHGDLKDDQFFLTETGSVVLGDFGTAWRLRVSSSWSVILAVFFVFLAC
jgi:serine/threonine protein kinase